MPIFHSPYLSLDRPARWLKGNHHGHTTFSDGEDAPEETIDAYERAGYDYIALSEHDLFVDAARFQNGAKLILLPAVEVTSASGQTIMLLDCKADFPAAGSCDLAGLAAFAERAKCLLIVDHPNWEYQPGRLHAPLDEIAAASSITAIEIYTGVIERLPGQACATDVWDRLLSAGRLVFGHATDDQHSAVDRFRAWNIVQIDADDEVSSRAIIAALVTGRFIASTGVHVSRIGTIDDGRSIVVESDAEIVRWYVRGGVLAHEQADGCGRLSIDDIPELPRLARPWRTVTSAVQAGYVRLECLGRGGRRAWSQPFMIAP